jgi:hypothetical protein
LVTQPVVEAVGAALPGPDPGGDDADVTTSTTEGAVIHPCHCKIAIDSGWIFMYTAPTFIKPSQNTARRACK